MERCTRCRVRENEVKLFDAIHNGRMSSLCERCAIIENIPIIKKPDTSQLKESEQSVGVFDRMKRLSGIKNPEKDETFFREDKLNELNENPTLELPEKEKLNLTKHFHWEIMKNRRRKGLSQQQLAETLGESEIAISLIEKAKLPENAESLINKLEQFFQIKLRKVQEIERIMQEKEQTPVLLNQEGERLEKIPEEEPEIKESAEEIISDTSEIQTEPIETQEYDIQPIEPEEQATEHLAEDEELRDKEGTESLAKDFEIQKVNLDQVTIQDLKEIHKRKVQVTKQEMKEEQTKIEERQRLIEARKEELRLRREKESDELDKSLGGTELLNESEDSDIPTPDEDEINPNL